MRTALILVAIITLSVIISSFQLINGKTDVNTYHNNIQGQCVIPIKQSYFIVTTEHRKALKLIKEGWELQDVDVSQGAYSQSVKYYTLIKYVN